MPKPSRHILVCTNTRPPGHPRGSCGEKRSPELLMNFMMEIENKGLFQEAIVTGTQCIGPCGMGPIVVVYPEGTWYRGVTPADVSEIVQSHIVDGKPVERLVMPEEVWG